MFHVGEDEFEELVTQALETIPPEFLEQMTNVVMLIDDYHPDSPQILGLYHGVALPERTAEYSGVLPDTITLYKAALEEVSFSAEELAAQIRVTVLHEIGHYFGLDDADLHRLGYG